MNRQNWEMISRKTEEKYLLVPLVKHLEYQLSGAKPAIDLGDPYTREVEWFELFFSFDGNVGFELREDTADGWQALAQLVRSATDLVIERWAEAYQTISHQTYSIGICAQTEWRWNEEVKELEAMIGKPADPDGLAGCWRFAVRFAPKPPLVEGRCLASPSKQLLLAGSGLDPFAKDEARPPADSSTNLE